MDTYSKNSVNEGIVATVAHREPMTREKDQFDMLKSKPKSHENITVFKKEFTYLSTNLGMIMLAQ